MSWRYSSMVSTCLACVRPGFYHHHCREETNRGEEKNESGWGDGSVGNVLTTKARGPQHLYKNTAGHRQVDPWSSLASKPI